MNWITDLLGGSGIASSLLYVFLTCALGAWAGKLRIAGVKLGIAGVLFVGIILAHFGARVDAQMLHFAQEFGLILFVYAIGIDVGPRFFSSLRSDGLLLNALAIAIVLLGFGVALAFHAWGGVDATVMAGVMCGAVTNTPGLGAAKQVVADYLAANPGACLDDALLGSGYAMAYPLGVVGIIVSMIALRPLFRIRVSDEERAYNDQLNSGAHIESIVVTLRNPGLWGKTVEQVTDFVDKEFTFSRIERGGSFVVPAAETVLREGDLVHGVAKSDHLDDLRLKLGPVEIGQKNEPDGPLAMQKFLFTNHKLAGKTIEQIGIYRRYPANITRIVRGGMVILPSHQTAIEIGDQLRVVGSRECMKEVGAELGDSIREWSHPNILSLTLGIVAGLVIGAIPIALPGMPVAAKLGLAGGPLLAAILLAAKGRIGGLSFYMNSATNMVLRELGIAMFLGCVGLGAGGHFVATFLQGGYLWVLYGLAVTLIPLALVTVAARLLRVNYLKICGLVSGATTDPCALEFANSLAPTQAQATAYATVYPITMFLRIVLGQAFILLTL